MDRAVSCQPALPLEANRTDHHVKVAFAPFLVPGVTTMSFTVVPDQQMVRGKGFA